MHSNAPQLKLGAFNWRNYNNPEMDKYLQAAAVEMDEAKRRTYLQQAGELTAQERPLIPLVAVSSAWTLRKDKVRMQRTRVDEDTLAMDIVPAN